VSTGAQIAVLPPVGRHGERTRAQPAPTQRPLVRLAAVGTLGLYGILRWGTMLSPAPMWRLLGLLGLCLALAAAGTARPVLGRSVVALAAVAAVFAMFALSGVPLAWVVHLRVAVTVSWIEGGLSALPGVMVPYSGINQWVRVIELLGAGVLLLDAGLLLAFVPRGLGDLRRAGAALPLIALAVVPSTLVRPQLPYLQGLILFALLALMMWGERVRRDDLAAVLALGAIVGVAGMFLAPMLDPRTPWLDPRSFAGSLSPTHVDSFDWTQRYGPLNWPRTGHEVLDVKPSQGPDYWKAEDLDSFDGFGWVADNVQQGSLPPADRAAVRRWTQTIQVTIRAMTSTDVIAAGFASQPNHISGLALSGLGAGTWMSTNELGPGDSYSVRVYTPHPTPDRLATAYDGAAGGAGFPLQALQGYMTLTVPQAASSKLPPQSVFFAPYGSGAAPQNLSDVTSVTGPEAIAGSPYARAYALARQLAREARTPYAYVRSVEHYLSTANGFQYDENPPLDPHPLESFLFTNKRGYCQQFAGAMALLLRLGGIPARVATGFTSGTYNSASREWVVSDIDAHSWVEVWFPHYGWVRFDPTPGAAPARGGRTPITSLAAASKAGSPVAPRHAVGGLASTTPSTKGSGGGASVALIGLLVALAVILVLVVVATRGIAEPSGDQLLAELERALARSGRPISPGVTLVELEHRFRTSADAAGYVRAIRAIRFGGAGAVPSRRQRRALRSQLRAGLGLGGRLRALWALPPQWLPPASGLIGRMRGIRSAQK
jgi:transglutaminase-like putative cysteine protease